MKKNNLESRVEALEALVSGMAEAKPVLKPLPKRKPHILDDAINDMEGLGFIVNDLEKESAFTRGTMAEVTFKALKQRVELALCRAKDARDEDLEKEEQEQEPPRIELGDRVVFVRDGRSCSGVVVNVHHKVPDAGGETLVTVNCGPGDFRVRTGDCGLLKKKGES